MSTTRRARLQNLVKLHPPFRGVRGAIVRLKIQDFMTYRAVELHAGPNVNLILGPNGTGKSTIVCAICIGLAGKPRILGRASSLKQYIRHGCHSATIEVELYNPGGKNYIIKRHIKETSTGATSSWFFNGMKTQPAQVEELLKKLNIQLDNLCQFLPQDRVQEFSKMDAYSLLRSTQQALGTETLTEKHDRLMTLNETVKQLEYTLRSSHEHLRNEQQYNQRLENEVKNYHERQRMKKQIENLISKKAWLIYSKAIHGFSKLKAEVDHLKVKRQEEQSRLRPLKLQVQALDTKLIRYNQEMNHCRSSNLSSIHALTRKYEDDVDDIEVKVNGINAEVAVQEKAEEDRKERLDACLGKLNALEDEFEKLRKRGDLNFKALNVQIQELHRVAGQFSEKIFEIDGEKDMADLEEKGIRAKIRHVEAELRRLDEMRNSRLKYLQRENYDAFRAVELFSRDESKAVLKGIVYEPMALHLCVKDLKYGSVVERHIGHNEMTSFFCDDKDDLEVMLELCRRNRIRISITYHSLPLNWRRPPSGFKPEYVKRYDFQYSVLDLIEGPDYYLSYLCDRFRMHYTPVGGPRTDSLFDRISTETHHSLWYTHKSVYTAKKSTYGGVRCSSVEFLAPPRIFTNTINQLERDKLLKARISFEAEIQRIRDAVIARLPERNRYLDERAITENKVKEIRARMEYVRGLRVKIENSKRAKLSLESDVVDLDSLRKSAAIGVWAERKKIMKSIKWLGTESRKNSKKGISFFVLRRQVNLMDARRSAKQDLIEELELSIQDHNEKLRVMEDHLRLKAAAAEKYKREAQKSTLREMPSDVADGRIRLEQIETELTMANCQIAFLVDTDASIVHDYQERCKKIDKLAREKSLYQERLAELKREIIHKKEEWLGPLRELVNRINDNFGQFFTNMGCAGEVSLCSGEDENDFTKYGIKIMVKFRASEPLAEMCGATKGGTLQSGGERVITTALYVLALQELTVVPFRVIDEINQGMDAKNETRFFQLLCSMAKGDNTPQYFLLTPKMLPKVEYPDNVLFHFIMNGSQVNVPFAGPGDHDSRHSAREDDD